MTVWGDYDEIVKEVTEDGETIYRHPTGRKVETYTESLDSMLNTILERLRGLNDLMGDTAYGDFVCISEALLRAAGTDLEEAVGLIENNIGEIEFDFVCNGQYPYRSGKVLSVSFKPAREKPGEPGRTQTGGVKSND